MIRTHGDTCGCRIDTDTWTLYLCSAATDIFDRGNWLEYYHHVVHILPITKPILAPPKKNTMRWWMDEFVCTEKELQEGIPFSVGNAQVGICRWSGKDSALIIEPLSDTM